MFEASGGTLTFTIQREIVYVQFFNLNTCRHCFCFGVDLRYIRCSAALLKPP